MKDLTEQMVKSVVDYPEQVEITEVEGTDSLILEIRVSQEDMGKVIGRNGRIINAMRTIVSAASAAKGSKRTSLEIIEPEGGSNSLGANRGNTWSA
ncbi:TPA: KH domain-containing protein [Candidatus Poribacteria bacterium]|nr:KH domain-containing protein [Candidatus Poribacteria bacterium]